MATGPTTPPAVVIPHTKVGRPRMPARFALRERLLSAIDEAVTRPLTVVSAPAGSGKSTALAAWHKHRDAADSAWLSLDPDDNDPTRLLHGLVAAIRTVAPDVGETALDASSVSSQGIRDVSLPSLVNDVAALDETIVLTLDDYHLITNRDVHDAMGFLVTNLPANWRLVILSRFDPPLPLARLRLHGELGELRAEDLSLTEDEARELLETGYGVSLPANGFRALYSRTEGWTAGVCLGGMWLSQAGAATVDGFVNDDGNLVDYLGTEILASLPDDLRRFLLETSVLDELEPAVCDHLRQAEDSRDQLAELDRRNLFVIPLDRGRQVYRYHHLFGEWLRGELARAHGDAAPDLHQRAALWFQERGHHSLALPHLLAAGRGEEAMEILVARVWEVAMSAAWEDLMRLIDELPHELRSAAPLLDLVHSWAAILGRHPERAETWRAAALAAHDQAPDDHDAALAAYEATAMGVAERLFSADAAGCQQAAEAADAIYASLNLELIPDGWVGALTSETHGLFMLDPELAHGRLGDCLERIETELAIQDRSLSRIQNIPYLLGMRATAEAEAGDPATALSTAQEAMRFHDEHRDFATAESVLALAIVAEFGPADDAATAVERISRVVEPTSADAFFFAYYLTTRALFACRTGEIADAASAIEEAESVIAEATDPGVLRDRLRRAKEEWARAQSVANRTEDYGKPLTDRELSILRAFEGNLTQREIGRELYLSFNTVKTYSRTIFRKLGVSSREDAITAAKALDVL